MQGLPNFLARDFVTLNNTLTISHSPLAAGPIRNAECMEFLLAIAQKASQVGDNSPETILTPTII